MVISAPHTKFKKAYEFSYMGHASEHECTVNGLLLGAWGALQEDMGVKNQGRDSSADLAKAKLVILSISLHESHESVPVIWIFHDVHSLYPLWFAIDKFGRDIYCLNGAFIIYHVQARDLPELFCCVQHSWFREYKSRGATGPIARSCKLDVWH